MTESKSIEYRDEKYLVVGTNIFFQVTFEIVYIDDNKSK